MIARPLLERLEAVRGEVDLVVLRPPTLDALRDGAGGGGGGGGAVPGGAFRRARGAGRPPPGGGGGGRGMFQDPAAEGVLVFEKPGGGPDQVPASRVAQVLAAARVPVVVLNACQSGAVGKELEAAVATRLLREGGVGGGDGLQRVRGGGGGVHGGVLRAAVRRGHGQRGGDRRAAAAVPARTGGRARRGSCRWRTGWCRCTTCAASVSFPQARHRTARGEPSLEEALDRLRAPGAERLTAAGSLDPVGVFVGRDDLFFQLEAAARLQQVVVLHGPGGTGKTELAKAFGRWWRDTGGVERPELGVLAFVRAGRGLVRPGRGDHRDRAGGVRRRFRPPGPGRAAAAWCEELLRGAADAADLGQLRDRPVDAGPGRGDPAAG